MPKNLNISIPKPCHEDWDLMSPQQQGRHCSSCNKVVVDFTTMSDAQLVEYFTNNKTKTCGRFRNDQVERKIRLRCDEKSLFPYKYLAASLLATGAFWQTAGARDLHDTILSPVIQTEQCFDDTATATTDIVDSVDSMATGADKIVGEASLPYEFPLTGDTTFTITTTTISGGVGITLGFCSMPYVEPQPEFNPDEVVIPKHKPYKLPNVGPVLQSRVNRLLPASPAKIPGKRLWDISVATIVNRLRIKRQGE